MKIPLTKLIPILTAFLSNWMKNRKHNSEIKNFDKTEEKINIIENLIVRLERKIKESRDEISELKQQIMISRYINIGLGVLVLIGLFLNYIN